MDHNRFDQLTRAFGKVAPRRRLARALPGVLGLLTLTLTEESALAVCRPGGKRCAKAGQCCSKKCNRRGRCLAVSCKADQKQCNGVCISKATCCNDQCATGQECISLTCCVSLGEQCEVGDAAVVSCCQYGDSRIKCDYLPGWIESTCCRSTGDECNAGSDTECCSGQCQPVDGSPGLGLCL